MTATRNRPKMDEIGTGMYDWLAANGIVGWLPEHATITVRRGKITYPVWRHLNPNAGPWDKDVMVASDRWTAEERAARWDDPAGDLPVVDMRTVPLLSPVTSRVRALARLGKLNLVERLI